MTQAATWRGPRCLWCAVITIFATSVSSVTANAAPGVAAAQVESPTSENAGFSQRAFNKFVAGWAGHYDNRAQYEGQIAAGLPETKRNQRLELRIVPIDAPAFGSRAFYAEWFAPASNGATVRQRIYAFERDAATGAGILRLHIFPSDAAFVARTAGAWHDPARLRGLTPDDMAPLRGCDVWFYPANGLRAGAVFKGEMEKGRCHFPSFEDPSREVYSWSQMTKTNRVFSYLDGWFNMDGSVYRILAPNWYVFEKRSTMHAPQRGSKR